MSAGSSLGTIYVEVGADLSALTKDLQGAMSEAATAGQQIGQSLEQGITTGTAPAAQGLHGVGDAARDAEGGISGLGGSLGELAAFAGIALSAEALAEGLADIAKEAIEAFSKIQLVEVALTSMTGSAEATEKIMSSIKDLALGSIFSIPELATTAQKLANFGVEAEKIPAAVHAIALAAEASGNSLDTAAGAFNRITESGNLSGRTLTALGLKMTDLQETTGLTAEELKKSFKEMGPGSADSINILIATIDRLKAKTGEDIVGTFAQQMNALKVQWDELLVSIGGAVAGPIGSLLASLNGMIATFHEFGAAIHSIGGSGGFLTEMFPQIQIVGGAWSWFKEQILAVTAAIEVAKGNHKSFADTLAELEAKTSGVTSATNASKEADDLVNAALAGSIEVAQKAALADDDRKQRKELLTAAVAIQAAAEKAMVEDIRALQIPAIKDLQQAEDDVATTRAGIVIADGLLRDAEAALNAEKAKAVPSTTALKQLEEDVKTATEGTTLARQAAKDAEGELTKSRTSAKDVATQLADDEKSHAEYLKTVAVPTIMNYQTALDAVNSTKKDAADKDAALTKAETDYNAAVKSGDPGAIAIATGNLKDARDKLKTSTDSVKTAEDNLKKSQDAVLKANQDILKVEKDLNDFYTQLYVPHITTLKDAIAAVTEAQKEAVDQANLLRQAELEVQNAIDREGNSTQTVLDLTKKMQDEKQKLNDKVKTLNDTLKTEADRLGITIQELKLLKDSQDDTKTSADILADAYENDGLRTQASLELTKQAAQDAYNAIIQDPSAGLSQKLAALQKETDAEIALGQSVPVDQQLQLAKMTQQTKDFIADQATRWTDLSNKIHDQVQNMFSGLITDFFNGAGFVKTMTDTLKSIGESIVSAVFKPFTDLISQTISSLLTPLAKTLAGWISDALSLIFPSLANLASTVPLNASIVANTISVDANTAALGVLSGALGAGAVGSAVGGVAEGAGSAAGGIAQTVTQTATSAIVGVVAGVVSAISGVISNFQQHDELSKLKYIEENTRSAAFYLGGDNSGGGILHAIYMMDENLQYGYMSKNILDIHDKFMAIDFGNLTLKSAPGAPTAADMQAATDAADAAAQSAKAAYDAQVKAAQAAEKAAQEQADAAAAAKAAAERTATDVSQARGRDTTVEPGLPSPPGGSRTDTDQGQTPVGTGSLPSAPGGSRTDTSQNPGPTTPSTGAVAEILRDMGGQMFAGKLIPQGWSMDQFGNWIDTTKDISQQLKDLAAIFQLQGPVGQLLAAAAVAVTTPPTAKDVAPTINLRGDVYLDGQSLQASYVRWQEDNGLVIPQS